MKYFALISVFFCTILTAPLGFAVVRDSTIWSVVEGALGDEEGKLYVARQEAKGGGNPKIDSNSKKLGEVIDRWEFQNVLLTVQGKYEPSLVAYNHSMPIPVVLAQGFKSASVIKVDGKKKLSLRLQNDQTAEYVGPHLGNLRVGFQAEEEFLTTEPHPSFMGFYLTFGTIGLAGASIGHPVFIGTSLVGLALLGGVDLARWSNIDQTWGFSGSRHNRSQDVTWLFETPGQQECDLAFLKGVQPEQGQPSVKKMLRNL